MSFDWQTEEEAVAWDDPIAPQEAEKLRPRRRWPWVVLAILLLSATAVFILVRTVGQRVEVATDEVEDELLASVTVIQKAAVDGDVELFTSFLSGKNYQWAQSSERLVDYHMYLDRPTFDLQWIAVDAETAVISSTLSPELQRAELLSEYKYEMDIGNGLTETVILQQTAVYRLGPNRWLLAPPEPEFWGETWQIEGKYLTVTYPARDDALVQQLAADLEVELAGYCILLGDACDYDFPLAIEFSTGLDNLTLSYSLLDTYNAYDLSIPLTTPTLVGLPIDQVGYDALYRGYATQLLWSLLLTKYETDCCGQLLLEATMPYLLWQLGVWREDTAVDWDALLENHIPLRNTETIWANGEATDEDRQFANALLSFLIEEVGIPPLLLLQTLAETSEATLPDFLLNNFADQYSPDLAVWEDGWRAFVAQQVMSGEG